MDVNQIYCGDHFAIYTYICNHYVVHPDDVMYQSYLNKTEKTRENKHVIISERRKT